MCFLVALVKRAKTLGFLKFFAYCHPTDENHKSDQYVFRI